MPTQPAKARQTKGERRQRRYPRFRVEFPVEVTVFSAGDREQLGGHCRDLSVAGIGVLIAAEVTLGEVAVLSFSLPGVREPWKLQAVLRHRRGYHYGFEFLSLNGEQSQALADFLPKLDRADRDSSASMRAEAAKA
ncbi:MAG TPA: PilZ domain-containing protein [Candidatus Sulfotelmatobacter sp.]|nr:PilZ domain-containing protein [Candidatus Sulfotelmatobacter sp.]